MDNLAIDKSKKPSKECCICLDILILYTEQNRTEHRRLQKLSPDDEINTLYKLFLKQQWVGTLFRGNYICTCLVSLFFGIKQLQSECSLWLP